MTTKISLIAAVSKNGVIGNNGTLPWYLKKDFAWFVSQTTNKTVVMGRKNYEDIIHFTKGKPLKNRTNIILTKQNINPEGFIVFNSIESMLEKYPNEHLMIIGGTQIYEQFIPYADELILTEINKEYKGDSFFPKWNKNDFTLNYDQPEEENDIHYNFRIYKRNK